MRNNDTYFSIEELNKLIELDMLVKENSVNASIIDIVQTFLKKAHEEKVKLDDGFILIPQDYEALWDRFKKTLPVYPNDKVWFLQLQQISNAEVKPVPISKAFQPEYIDINCRLKEGLFPSEERLKECLEKQQELSKKNICKYKNYTRRDE